jgi:uncharacterized protein (DUF1778 family)
MASKSTERLKKRGEGLIWSTYTNDEKRLIRSVAGREDKTMAEFVHDAALTIARIKQREFIDSEKNLEDSAK